MRVLYFLKIVIFSYRQKDKTAINYCLKQVATSFRNLPIDTESNKKQTIWRTTRVRRRGGEKERTVTLIKKKNEGRKEGSKRGIIEENTVHRRRTQKMRRWILTRERRKTAAAATLSLLHQQKNSHSHFYPPTRPPVGGCLMVLMMMMKKNTHTHTVMPLYWCKNRQSHHYHHHLLLYGSMGSRPCPAKGFASGWLIIGAVCNGSPSVWWWLLRGDQREGECASPRQRCFIKRFPPFHHFFFLFSSSSSFSASSCTADARIDCTHTQSESRETHAIKNKTLTKKKTTKAPHGQNEKKTFLFLNNDR